MTKRVAETLAKASGDFASVCYRHDYGCVQSIVSCKVIPVVAFTGVFSPYVYNRQERTNRFIKNLLRG